MNTSYCVYHEINNPYIVDYREGNALPYEVNTYCDKYDYITHYRFASKDEAIEKAKELNEIHKNSHWEE